MTKKKHQGFIATRVEDTPITVTYYDKKGKTQEVKKVDVMKNPHKERFLQVFPNIPLGERLNAIYMSPEYGPMTWYIVWLEVRGDTKVGKEACETLKEMGII